MTGHVERSKAELEEALAIFISVEKARTMVALGELGRFKEVFRDVCRVSTKKCAKMWKSLMKFRR